MLETAGSLPFWRGRGGRKSREGKKREKYWLAAYLYMEQMGEKPESEIFQQKKDLNGELRIRIHVMCIKPIALGK